MKRKNNLGKNKYNTLNVSEQVKILSNIKAPVKAVLETEEI